VLSPFRAKIVLLAGLVGLFSLAVPSRAEKRVELKKWIDGPVRYITIKEEVKQFRSLESDEGRALFIEKFWRRRDPSPGSLANEYRELFWHRVQEANSNFLDSTRPGWMTDRGKIHILYGPPTETENAPDLASGSTTGHGVIRWIYEGRPGERMDMNPIVVVPFQRDTSGEYRLSYDPKLASVFFDATAISEGRTDQYDRFFEMMGSPTHSELSVMLDLGRMQEIPPADQVLLESVETMEAYHTLPLKVDVNRYFQPQDGSAVAVVNVDLREIGVGEKPAIVARFVPLDSAQPTRMLGEDSFRVAQLGEYRLAQGRLELLPGQYALTVIVADPLEAKTGIHRATISAPERPRTLRLSDVVWAVEVAAVDYASLASYTEPFHVGPFRVLPKLEPVYRQGEAAKLFFEVYGAEYPLRATYQLEGLDENGDWIRLGQPAVLEQSAAELAWELQTSARWPVGEYRVRVEVLDAGEHLVTAHVAFTLAGAGSS
jgi:GWxTD domain-containing protein